jgi:hypothetical protein
MKLLQIPAFFIFFWVISSSTLAQPSTADSLIYEKTLYNTIAFFRNSLKEKSLLYTGREYIQYGNGIKGHPYFQQDSLQTGTVSYDGISYPGIPLKYDIYQDILIVRDYDKSSLIELLREKISWFQISSHRFVYLSPPKEINKISSGFYELLLSHPLSTIYARRIKQVPVTSKSDEQQQFAEKSVYYIMINDVYFDINDKESLLHVFKDKKDALKKYIKENNINFKKALEGAIINTTTHYHTLKQIDGQ